MKLTDSKIKKIGKFLKVNFKKIPYKEFKMGLYEEFEHKDIIGDCPILAGMIAHVHLKEHPRYYTILKKAFKNK